MITGKRLDKQHMKIKISLQMLDKALLGNKIRMQIHSNNTTMIQWQVTLLKMMALMIIVRIKRLAINSRMRISRMKYGMLVVSHNLISIIKTILRSKALLLSRINILAKLTVNLMKQRDLKQLQKLKSAQLL